MPIDDVCRSLTDELIWEHVVAYEQLRTLERLVELGDYAQAAAVKQDMYVQLIPHAHKEEEILFPEIASVCAAAAREIARLNEQHAREAHLAAAFDAAIAGDEPDEVEEAARVLVTHVREHMRREEQTIFPMVAVLLQEDSVERALAHFARVERERQRFLTMPTPGHS